MFKIDGKTYYPGYYEGKVVSISAPATEPTGAVQVRVPQIHGNVTKVPDTSLPWAAPNLMFAGRFAGLIGVPPVGANVNLIMKHANKDFPMWIGGSIKTGETPPDYTTAKQGLEPKGWGWLTPAGYGIFFDEKAQKITLKTPQGLYKMEMDVVTKTITISTTTGQSLTLDETAKKVILQDAAGQSVELDETATKAILTGAFMEIGKNATEAAVLGNAFATLWIAHGHLYTPALHPGPPNSVSTSPPVDALTLVASPMVAGTELSAVSKIK